MQKLYIIKIGGNVIDKEEKLKKFLADFALLKGCKMLVHGGGKIATEISRSMGIETKMVEGRRITDAETLRLVTMVYAGLINKNIVASLQSMNCNAIGLCGADANCIPADKRTSKEIDYGFVGDITEANVNSSAVSALLAAGLSPVFSPLTHDGKGQLLNTNADTIASALAVAMSKLYEVSLVYCFEKKGVLRNKEDENSFIPEINYSSFQELKKEGVISEGMIPKLDNAFEAIKKGVTNVIICHADYIKDVISEGEITGTKIIN